MLSISNISNSMNNYGQVKLSAKSPAFCSVDVSDLIKKGDDYLNNNKPQDALNSYKQAIQKNPNEIDIYKKLGKTYTLLKDYDSAIVSYNSYLEHNKENDEVWVALSEAQRLKGLYGQGIKSLETASSINSKNDLIRRSMSQIKNDISCIYSPASALHQKEAVAEKNLETALKMVVDYLGEDYMKDFSDVEIRFGQTAEMSGVANIAQYENSKKTITVSDNYKYASAQVIAAYLVHESVHARDKDPYTSIREEQDAYRLATKFWIENADGISDPDMDYAAELYKQAPSKLDERVAEIYKLRQPDIPETSPNHPAGRKDGISNFFANRKNKPVLSNLFRQKAASQSLKQYEVIA